MSERLEPPFERTVCSCKACVDCCREQPGPLMPGDLERIAAYLGLTVEEASARFWASPGARVGTVVGDAIVIRAIGTITPRYDRRRKACTFLKDGQCEIHAVAPYGCAYFDTHQSSEEGRARSTWYLRLVESSPEYRAQRARLPYAETWKPKGF